MKWRKLGVLFCPENVTDWMVSHAANPIALPLGGSIVRIYFTCRDAGNRSSIAWMEADLRQPGVVRRLAAEPLLRPGRPGLFDDSGCAAACLLGVGAETYLYYLGWNLGVTVPWRNSIGLAIGDSDGLRFSKYGDAPIVDRAHVDPFSISYPWVMREGERWRMWYGSNLDWGADQKDMAHVIKYGESDDGIHWRRDGRIAIGLAAPDEYALAKPCVVREDRVYRMWYSYRGPSYRIGYGESADGLVWQRKDGEVGIDVSASGWDAEMIEYGYVIDLEGERYMLYNGNGYGRTGVGLAVLES